MHARRVLLIGGGGFIGRALGRRLAASGCEVHALSRHVEPGRRGDVEFHRGSQAETAVVPYAKRTPLQKKQLKMPCSG